MDAIDILGGLLGRKRGDSGKGPDMGDILRRGRQPEPERRGGSASPSSHMDISAQARELEDMLNVTNDREVQRRSGQASPSPSRTTSAPRTTSPPSRTPSALPQQKPSGGSIAVVSPYAERSPDDSRQNELALVLCRAMVSAAKADGQVSPQEQQSILQHFEGSSAEATRFLREELSRPLDVREFAWSVPIGMEQQVYGMSLLAIDVDARSETQYLADLAHGLRLTPEVCEQLQQRYGRETRR